jgi:hypothetical protein
MSIVTPESRIEKEAKLEMGTFPKGYMSLFKTLSSQFSKVQGVSSCETWSDEDISLIALIQRFPVLERD